MQTPKPELDRRPGQTGHGCRHAGAKTRVVLASAAVPAITAGWECLVRSFTESCDRLVGRRTDRVCSRDRGVGQYHNAVGRRCVRSSMGFVASAPTLAFRVCICAGDLADVLMIRRGMCVSAYIAVLVGEPSWFRGAQYVVLHLPLHSALCRSGFAQTRILSKKKLK